MTKSRNIGRGGVRPGAGRPYNGYDTAIVRMPIALLDTVKAMIEEYKKQYKK